MIDTQAHSPSMIKRGRAAGIQLGLSCEDLVALGLQPSASLLTAVAVADGQCSSEAQCSDAQLADRADAPRIAYSSRARPLHTPLDEETKEDLLLELDSDVHARSSVASQQSLLATWTRLHVRWFGGNSPPFPTWPLAVRAIASQMKLAGYRSFGNYLSRAKREHINTGGTWNQLLERVGADCVKSVMRGLGPGRQSAPYPLEQVAVLRLNELPLVEQGPVNPRALAVLGAWFLNREIELSLALCKNVTVVTNGGVLAVKWRLPASKTDPMAVAVVRELGCMCQGCSAVLCPAHVTEEHFRTLAKLFGPNVPRDLPLFPSLDGQAVAKGAVVRTFECLAERCGKSLLDDLGRRAIGGHSARVTGARFYAGLGIELRRLAVFARWRSDIVLHYVQDSALLRFAAECVVLLRKDSPEQISSDDHMERVHIRSRIVKIEQAISLLPSVVPSTFATRLLALGTRQLQQIFV